MNRYIKKTPKIRVLRENSAKHTYDFTFYPCPFCDMGSYICNQHSPLPNPLSQETQKKNQSPMSFRTVSTNL